MKKILTNILMVICLCIFCFSLYKIVSYYYGSYKSESRIDELEEMVIEDAKNEMSFRERYKKLVKQNSDMVGWIKIEDTKVNYPVMQTPNDEEFYLRRNFDKEYEFRGTPFLNAEANLQDISDNMIMYAHNMDDGTMFGDLEKYRSFDFYKKHKTFQFDTIYHVSTYEIVAVFQTVDNPEHSSYIDYYNFFNIDDEKKFNDQIKKYKQMSFYETGVTPTFGDHLLTLSTCEYSNKDGRFVIVARRIEENERN